MLTLNVRRYVGRGGAGYAVCRKGCGGAPHLKEIDEERGRESRERFRPGSAQVGTATWKGIVNSGKRSK